MKIAVTAQGTTLESAMDPRFGRAPYILVVDTETREFEVLDNAANVNAFKGAGIQAATLVADKGARVLLTGYCGPKAFQVIQAAGIKVVSDMTGTVSEAVDQFNRGDVSFASGANAEAHW